MQLRCGLYVLLMNGSLCGMVPVIEAVEVLAKAVLEEEMSSDQSSSVARIPTPPPLPLATIDETRVSEIMVRHYFRSHQQIMESMIPAVAEQLRVHADSPVAETSKQATNFMRVISETNSEEACETEYARSIVLDTMRLQLEEQHTQMQTLQIEVARIRSEHVSKKKAAIITAGSSLFSALTIFAVSFFAKK